MSRAPKGTFSIIVEVLRRLRPHRTVFFLAILQVLVLGILELAKPWPLKIIVDNVLGGKPLGWGWFDNLDRMAMLAFICTGLVGVYLLIGILSVTSNYSTISVGQRMVNDFRGQLYAHLCRLSLAFHSRREVGDLLFRLTSDTFAIQTLTMNGFFPILTSLVLLAGMAVVMLRIDLTMTLIALVIVPVLLVTIAKLSSRVNKLATDSRVKESAMWSVAQRSMGAIRVIQAFTTEQSEHRRFVNTSSASLDANLRLYTFQTIYSAFVNVLIAIGTAAVLWFGASQVMQGHITVGDVLVFASYLASLYAPINSLTQTWGLIQNARAGAERVIEVLNTAPDLVDGEGPLRRADVRGRIEFQDVHFWYEKTRPVLQGVSLRVDAGSFAAFVGATGAGKTTLASLIPRFYDPVSGQILLDDVDIRNYRLSTLRAQIGMVLQPPLVFPTSLRENIAYGCPAASDEEIARAATLAQLDNFIARLPEGLDTIVGEGGATLSSGEQLRVTIARAILRDPRILIFDEPTSALDVDTETRFMSGLEHLLASRTTFVIAHRLSTVRRAHVIFVLDQGRIVEAGSFAELMARGGYFAKLYRTQFGEADDHASIA